MLSKNVNLFIFRDLQWVYVYVITFNVLVISEGFALTYHK